MVSYQEYDSSDDHLLYHSGESGGSYSFLKSTLRWSNIDGRRLLFATCACLAAASLFGLLSVVIWTQHVKFHHDLYQQVTLDQELVHSTVTIHGQTRTETHTIQVTVTASAELSIHTSSPTSKWKPDAVLKGKATERFRGNLSYPYRFCSELNLTSL